MASSTDRIEKQIVVAAPRSRVWRAITDHRQFNEWFGVALTSPFTPGAVVSGQITIEGYQHVTMTVHVVDVEPERRFSYRWHPGPPEPGADFSAEPMTLVTFTLEDVDGGTRLTVAESGFDAIPESRRIRAREGNASGWEAQVANVKRYVEGKG